MWDPNVLKTFPSRKGILLWSQEILGWTGNTIHIECVQVSAESNFFEESLNYSISFWGNITFNSLGIDLLYIIIKFLVM